LITAGLAAPAHAGEQPVVSVDQGCSDDEPHVVITLNAANLDESFTVFIDDMDIPEDEHLSNGEHSYFTKFDGFYHVVVYNEYTEQIVFDQMIGVACSGPEALFEAACEDDGGHIYALLINVLPFTWDVSVDDTPLPDFQDVPSTGQEWADLGAFANGEHDVSAVYTLEQTFDVISDTVTVDCQVDDSGSGAGIPPTGGSTSLALIAGLFVAAGGALLVTRRLRTA